MPDIILIILCAVIIVLLIVILLRQSASAGEDKSAALEKSLRDGLSECRRAAACSPITRIRRRRRSSAS